MPPNVSIPITWPWIVRMYCYPRNHCYPCQDRGVCIYPCTDSRIISHFPCDFGHYMLLSLHILGSDRYVYNSPFSWWCNCGGFHWRACWGDGYWLWYGFEIVGGSYQRCISCSESQQTNGIFYTPEGAAFVAQLEILMQRTTLWTISNLKKCHWRYRTRTGRQISMQSVYLKGSLTCNNPTLFKPPPDHIPLAESVEAICCSCRRLRVRWSSARATRQTTLECHSHSSAHWTAGYHLYLNFWTPSALVYWTSHRRRIQPRIGLRRSVGFGLANATRGPWFWASQALLHSIFLVCIFQLFLLDSAHCTALYIFPFILIIKLVHELTFLLFYTRLLLI